MKSSNRYAATLKTICALVCLLTLTVIMSLFVQSCSVSEEEKLERRLRGCWTSESNAFNGSTFMNDNGLTSDDIEISAISFNKDGNFEIITKYTVKPGTIGIECTSEWVCLQHTEGHYYASSPSVLNLTDIHITAYIDFTDELLRNDIAPSQAKELANMTEEEIREHLITGFEALNSCFGMDSSFPGIELDAEIDGSNLQLSVSNWMGNSKCYYKKTRGGIMAVRNKHYIRPFETYKRNEEKMADIVMDEVKKLT